MYSREGDSASAIGEFLPTRGSWSSSDLKESCSAEGREEMVGGMELRPEGGRPTDSLRCWSRTVRFRFPRGVSSEGDSIVSTSVVQLSSFQGSFPLTNGARGVLRKRVDDRRLPGEKGFMHLANVCSVKRAAECLCARKHGLEIRSYA